MYLTTCRGDDTTTQVVTTVTTESSGTSESPNVKVGNCSTFTSNDTCCTNTGCSWVVCLNATASVNHTGCHNLSDTADKKTAADECKVDVNKIEENVTCTFKPNTTTTTPVPTTASTAPTIPPAPMPGTCEAFTNQMACCGPDGLKLKCLYVNCTTKQDSKVTTLCLNFTSMASKCQPAKVICNSSESSTTVAPTTEPTTSNPTTTPSAPNSTTKAPPPTTLAPHTGTTEHGQHFDGASFIGGMILMAGLFIIGFFALKFYRARKDRSYRTL